MVRSHIIFLAVFTLVIFLSASAASAQIITGTFDWTGAADNGGDTFDPESGTATFSYDSATNVGTLTNFYTGFTEFFVDTVNSLGTIPNPEDPLSNIAAPITTFAGLTDFSVYNEQQPGIGFGGQPGAPIDFTLSNVWNLNGKGGINNTNWNATDGADLDPTIFTGTISNFKQTPEPATWIELALGALGLGVVGGRLRARRV